MQLKGELRNSAHFRPSVCLRASGRLPRGLQLPPWDSEEARGKREREREGGREGE